MHSNFTIKSGQQSVNTEFIVKFVYSEKARLVDNEMMCYAKTMISYREIIVKFQLVLFGSRR